MENPFEIILERLERIEDLIKQLSDNDRNPVQKTTMTIDEISGYLTLSKSYLYKLTAGSEIPHYKRGKRVYFNKIEIDNWALSNRIKTNEEINQEAIDYLVHRRHKK